MILEGVHFSEKAVRSMSYDDFEAQHVNVLWLDRDDDMRRVMLRKTYDLINKSAKQTKRKTE